MFQMANMYIYIHIIYIYTICIHSNMFSMSYICIYIHT